MEITTEVIKQLRDQTGVSVMQCKKALEETGGDMEKATALLLEKSADIANKKGDRALGSGVVESYVHSTHRIGAMVELLCETDFVANNEEFKKLARDIAMHITAAKPEFLSIESAGSLGAEEIPEKVLLEQSFIKNPEVTIKNLIQSATQKFGEKIELTQFTCYNISQ